MKAENQAIHGTLAALRAGDVPGELGQEKPKESSE